MPLAIYIVERIYRFYSRSSARTQMDLVALLPMPGRVTQVVLRPRHRIYYKPGQYCFINVRRIAVDEWHPFTISSAPDDPFVTVHVQAAGDWTSELYKLAKKVQAEILELAPKDPEMGMLHSAAGAMFNTFTTPRASMQITASCMLHMRASLNAAAGALTPGHSSALPLPLPTPSAASPQQPARFAGRNSVTAGTGTGAGTGPSKTNNSMVFHGNPYFNASPMSSPFKASPMHNNPLVQQKTAEAADSYGIASTDTSDDTSTPRMNPGQSPFAGMSYQYQPGTIAAAINHHLQGQNLEAGEDSGAATVSFGENFATGPGGPVAESSAAPAIATGTAADRPQGLLRRSLQYMQRRGSNFLPFLSPASVTWTWLQNRATPSFNQALQAMTKVQLRHMDTLLPAVRLDGPYGAPTQVRFV